MENIVSRITSMELSTMHIVSIVIFFLYILVSGIGFAVVFAAGRGYLDLAKGLRRILQRQDANGQLDDIVELSAEIQKYFDTYAKVNPAVNQRYSGIISWMDVILLKTNMFTDSTRGRKIFRAEQSLLPLHFQPVSDPGRCTKPFQWG